MLYCLNIYNFEISPWSVLNLNLNDIAVKGELKPDVVGLTNIVEEVALVPKAVEYIVDCDSDWLLSSWDHWLCLSLTHSLTPVK